MDSQSSIVIARPDPKALVVESAQLRSLAPASITSMEDQAKVQSLIIKTKAFDKRVVAMFEPTRKHFDEGKKELLALRDSIREPIANLQSSLEIEDRRWTIEQTLIAVAKHSGLEAVIRRREEDRLLVEAQTAQDAGNFEDAEAIVSERIDVPIIAVTPQVAKTKGLSTSKRRSAEVYDFDALVDYVAKNKQWLCLLSPSMPDLNRTAVSQGELMSIPGVRMVETMVYSSR